MRFSLFASLVVRLKCQLNHAPSSSVAGVRFSLFPSLVVRLKCQLNHAPSSSVAGVRFSLFPSLVVRLKCQLNHAPSSSVAGVRFSLFPSLVVRLKCQLNHAPSMRRVMLQVHLQVGTVLFCRRFLTAVHHIVSKPGSQRYKFVCEYYNGQCLKASMHLMIDLDGFIF